MPLVLSREHISMLRRLTSLPLVVMVDPAIGQPTYEQVAVLARFLTVIVPFLPVCSACGQPPATSWNGFCLRVQEGQCRTPGCQQIVTVDWPYVRLCQTHYALEQLSKLPHREAPNGLGLSRLMERTVGHGWQNCLSGRANEIMFLVCARYLVKNPGVWQTAVQQLFSEFSDCVDKLGPILHPIECQRLHPPLP